MENQYAHRRPGRVGSSLCRTTRTNASTIGIRSIARSVPSLAIVLAALWASRVRAWNPAVLGTEQRGTNFRYRSSASRLFASGSTGEPATASANTKDSSTVVDQNEKKLRKRLRDQRNRRPPQIVCCSSTKELVHAVNSIVGEDDVVAELGSQLRDVSDAIRERGSPSSVFCDVKRDYPKVAVRSSARKEPLSPNETTRINAMRLEDSPTGSAGAGSGMDFREIEKFSDWRSAFFRDRDSSSSSSCRYDVLVLDVNAIVGNDLEWTCLDLILEFEQMAAMVAKGSRSNSEDDGEDEYEDGDYHGLKYVLVKSLGLNSVASQLTYTVPWLDPNKTNHNRLCRIVATVGVHDYRQTIPGVQTLLQQSHLKAAEEKDGDNETSKNFVLEVGCHFGTSTVLLDETFDHVMGVDVGSKIIREAQRKHPGVFFRTGDAWKTAGLLRLQQEYYEERSVPSDQRTIGFDAVYVDVGGLSGADGLLDTIALVKSIQYALEPQCIVVKSLCLQRLAARFVPYWKWQKKGQAKLN